MRKHRVRKFLGLTVLYAVIIIGIFILQFKTESVISRNIGSLRITLAQTEKNDQMLLKNQMQVNFRGISFISTENQPITVSMSKYPGSSKDLILQSFTTPTELSALFTYTDGSSILFAVSDKTPQAQLTVTAHPSGSNDTISFPYKPETGYSIKEQVSNRLLISSKNKTFVLNASHYTVDHIIFTKSDLAISYTTYDPGKRFTFETITGLPLAESKSYDLTVKKIQNAIISQFNQMISSADSTSISEQDVIAYVAEMAQSGKYNEALDIVPESFKKGNKRTYLSSPYFDNLVSMNRSLTMQTDLYSSMVSSSISTKNLDIFTVKGIDDYILRQKRTSTINNLLAIPSSLNTFKPTVIQAAGILNIYTILSRSSNTQAALLEGVIDNCIKIIEEGCSVDNQILSITDNGNQLNTEQIVNIGTTLVNLGILKQRQDYQAAGYLLINNILSSTESIDLHTLSAIYPLLCKSNKFYPHTIILGYYGNKAVWAWTCAENISYTKQSDGTIDINISFPLSMTHYIIFNGVPTFHANIEIQKQKFRTDPRFETYNSSGYVYNEGSQTLFIKSRHKAQIELIRLFCDKEDTFILPTVATQIPTTTELQKSTDEYSTQQQSEATKEPETKSVIQNQTTVNTTPITNSTVQENQTEIETEAKPVTKTISTSTSQTSSQQKDETEIIKPVQAEKPTTIVETKADTSEKKDTEKIKQTDESSTTTETSNNNTANQNNPTTDNEKTAPVFPQGNAAAEAARQAAKRNKY